jgi:hypothetical protein
MVNSAKLHEILNIHYSESDRLRSLAEVLLTQEQAITQQTVFDILDRLGLKHSKYNLLAPLLTVHWQELNGRPAMSNYSKKEQSHLDAGRDIFSRLLGFGFSRPRDVVVLAAISIIGFMGIFPPWIYRYRNEGYHRNRDLGYWWITNPPANEGGFIGQIDFSRLAVQCVVVLIVTGGVLYFLKKKET